MGPIDGDIATAAAEQLSGKNERMLAGKDSGVAQIVNQRVRQPATGIA